MLNDQNTWNIKGLHETEQAGECALVCEDTSDSTLVFLKILDLKPGNEDF